MMECYQLFGIANDRSEGESGLDYFKGNIGYICEYEL